MDIGPTTVKAIAAVLQGAKTVIWNGPAGIFEFEQVRRTGRKGVAQALADSHATTIVGGGDSAAAVEKAGLRRER